MTEQWPMRRQPEYRETAHSLLFRFQRTLTKLPEFREAIAQKYPENDIDSNIKTFFSQDSRRSFSTHDYIPGIHFQKNGYEFNVNFWTQSKQLIVLRKDEDSSLLVNIAIGKNNQATAWYSEKNNTINLNQKAARQKAQELLTSLKSK